MSYRTAKLVNSGSFSVGVLLWRKSSGERALRGGEKDPVLVAVPTTIRLLLRIGIKVADEWQISLDYVGGSNVYVRGYLD